MANLQSIYQNTLKEITNNQENWLSYLKFAAKIHKYPFDQAVLVYAQNPNVDMLASADIWKQFNRRIIPESKAIMVYKYKNGQRIVDYLFDVSQTQGKHLERPTWEIQSEEREFISNDLSEGNSNFSLEESIDKYTEKIVKDIYLSVEDHVESVYAANSEFAKLENISSFFNLLVSSTQYAVREKCGLEQTPGTLDMSFVNQVSELSEINLLGYLVSTSTKQVMSKVANLKKDYIKGRIEQNDKQIDLSEARGRTSISRDSIQQRSDSRETIRDLREKGDDISSGESSNQIFRAANERDIDGEDSSSRDGSKRESPQSDGRITESKSSTTNRGSNGENQSSKHVEESSRRDRTEGTSGSSEIVENKLDKEPVAQNETGSFLLGEEESEQLDLFNDWDSLGEDDEKQNNKMLVTEIEVSNKITQSEILGVLLRGSGFENGKLRIANFFSNNPTNQEAVSFLKKEYGIGGRGGPNMISEMHDGKGIMLRKGNIMDPDASVLLKWPDVARQIEKLIKFDRYLTSEEKSRLEPYLEIQAQKQAEWEKHKNQESSVEVLEVQNKEFDNTLVEEVEKTSMVETQVVEEPVVEAPVIPVIVENYHYDPADNLYPNGEKTKYKNNVAAIRLLKQLEENKMNATPEQQKILAKYVGWGGLANVFSPNSEKWKGEYQELKSLLTEREYQEALESTITAYYTEPAIIEKIYKGLQNFGFNRGTILDPAMGTGNFFSVLPKELSEATLTGVEIDSITGRLAKQLYPNAKVLVQGFETTSFTDNQFDVVIGNIPFNNIQIMDPRYDAHNFLIHDYFIAKSLDVVKPGGIIAVITSKGTMDKKDTSTREYIASKSELLGAVRLPNNAFKALAGTEVTTDILFLKKRETPINVKVPSVRPKWIDIKPLPDNGIEINNYFIENPQMMLGNIEYDGFYNGSRQYACVPKEGQELIPSLESAINLIQGEFSAKADQVLTNELTNEEKIEVEETVKAPSGIKNFTYVVMDETLYYHENGNLILQKLGIKETERIIGMCGIRDALQNVIQIQTADYEESELEKLQVVLNEKYDSFVKKYGYLNERANQRAFYEDDQMPLLLSIEDEQEDKSYKKSAIFHKATIRPKTVKDYAESAQEALVMSLNRNMKVDIPYMAALCRKSSDEIIKELGNKIYLNPDKYTGDITQGWETSDEYLTGNVFDKLNYAKLKASEYPDLFARNVEALEDAQPPMLLPGDIHYRIGSPWIPKEYYQEFMYELFGTASYTRNLVKLEYFPYTNSWTIEGKNTQNSVKINSVYGTSRRNAYQIFEDCLNLQDSTVRDPQTYFDKTGKEQVKYVVNAKETMIARSKQQDIQEAFTSWLFKEPTRSEHLLKLYNERYNTIRPRTYDGSHLTFPEMNEEMQLRDHQKNVVARILSTGRALMAHEVGAGKTAAMIAAGMRLKQVGSVKKPMFVVMNHTIEQWAKEIQRFYPGANILVTTKKDFEKKNRQKFVSKIATGDYDAVVIGHSQFEKIPMSKEFQENNLRKEINTLSYEIQEAKKEEGSNWSVKQLVIFQKQLKQRLEKLINEGKKDDVINFEELGVDCLFVDEAHVYKNLYTLTKLRNVSGIGTSSSQRATDMKMKCEYIQQHNNGRGVIFATGTPITNSMSEFHVMQRFLQPDALQKAGLEFFDNWAATFGEVESSLEMTPEGSGYRMKSRFSKFHNLPELMNMFNLVSDIQTSDMLSLPVPELETGKAQIIVSECSDFQIQMMNDFVVRSEQIRDGAVDPSIDNMLKLTHEAKLMAIDPRLIDENAPVDENSKLNMCVRNVYKIWEETKENKSTQMIFCDSGTPKADQFNVYDEIKEQLIKKGIPSEEIAFIHDAKTDAQRDKLFSRMRKGDVRVLLGSTSKVGTGTNVQDLLIAGHHIDCPWRPADLTQRDGRIVRQGNQNKVVSIFRYVTRGTFDGYLWQIQEQKLRYISQVMTGKNISRSCDDTDETVLSAAEVKAIATDNPLLLEKMTLDNEINRLKLIRNRWSNEKATMEKNLVQTYPNRIEAYKNTISNIKNDISLTSNDKAEFSMILEGLTYFDSKEAGQAFKTIMSSKSLQTDESIVIGNFKGLDVFIKRNFYHEYMMGLKGASVYETKGASDPKTIISRLDNIIEELPQKIKNYESKIEQVLQQMEDVKLEREKPFAHEEQLKELVKKQTELNLKIEFEEQLKRQEKESNIKESSEEYGEKNPVVQIIINGAGEGSNKVSSKKSLELGRS